MAGSICKLKHLHALRHKAARKSRAQFISGLEHGCTLAELAVGSPRLAGRSMMQSRVFWVWLVAFGRSWTIGKYIRSFGLWVCPSWTIGNYNLILVCRIAQAGRSENTRVFQHLEAQHRRIHICQRTNLKALVDAHTQSTRPEERLWRIHNRQHWLIQ